jgi:hypothetical protein
MPSLSGDNTPQTPQERVRGDEPRVVLAPVVLVALVDRVVFQDG